MTPKSTGQSSVRPQRTARSARRRKVVSSLTIEQAAESWYRSQAARGHSIHTLRIRRQAITKLVTWLRRQGLSESLAEITKQDIERFLIDLHERFAANSVLTYFLALSTFFNWCVAEEELDVSPMKRLEKPQVNDGAPTVLTHEEAQALLRTCNGRSFLDRRDRAMFLLLIDTGMRLHELRQLTLDTVDLDTQTLTIMGKGKRPRKPHFDVAAASALDAYLRARTRFINERPHLKDLRALWMSGRGALSNNGIYEMVLRHARLAGLSGVHPHLFRHGFAHEWLAAGGSEGGLARTAGWTPGSKMIHRYGSGLAEQRAREEQSRVSPANRLLRPEER